MAKLFLLLFLLPLNVVAQIPSDTLLIENNQLVFFTISQSEYDSLNNLENSEGLNEVIGDFNYYTGKIITTYKDSISIDAKYSVAHYFRIKTALNDTLISKEDLSHIVGFIANNGDEFIIEEGIFSSAYLMQFIRRNFSYHNK